MIKTALVDADILLYRVGFGKEDESEEDAIAAMDQTIYSILEKVNCDYQIFYLSDSQNNFRKIIDPEYKANRGPKPKHYKILKNHIINVWCAEIAEGMEADDAMSLNCINTEEHQSILISIDKDLLQIPGQHYNFVKDEWTEVSEFLGKYNFYFQMLTGDPVDNVKGLKGIGKVKAEKILKDVSNEEDMYTAVRTAYKDDDYMVMQARLLWLLSNTRTNLIFKNHVQD